MEELGQMTREQRNHPQLEVDGLSARELDILFELVRGNTDREVAARLVLFEGTVKIHLREMMKKLGARNRTQLAAYGSLKGLTE